MGGGGRAADKIALMPERRPAAGTIGAVSAAGGGDAPLSATPSAAPCSRRGIGAPELCIWSRAGQTEIDGEDRG